MGRPARASAVMTETRAGAVVRGDGIMPARAVPPAGPDAAAQVADVATGHHEASTGAPTASDVRVQDEPEPGPFGTVSAVSWLLSPPWP